MAAKRTKVQELSIFTIGIGIILAVLTLWLTFALQPTPGEERSSLLLIVPLAIAVTYVVLGFLVRKFKSPGLIILTMILVAAGFGIDLIIGFNIVKAVIDVLVISMIVKTGREALTEINPEAVAD
jgi:hypothetical protein